MRVIRASCAALLVLMMVVGTDALWAQPASDAGGPYPTAPTSGAAGTPESPASTQAQPASTQAPAASAQAPSAPQPQNQPAKTEPRFWQSGNYEVQPSKPYPKNDFSEGTSLFPTIVGPYKPHDVPDVNFTNSVRLQQLLQGGVLRLGLADA